MAEPKTRTVEINGITISDIPEGTSEEEIMRLAKMAQGPQPALPISPTRGAQALPPVTPGAGTRLQQGFEEQFAGIQDLLREAVPGAELEPGPATAPAARFLMAQPERSTPEEKLAVLQKTMGLSDNDIVKANDPQINGGADIYFIKQPNGKWIEFDQPGIDSLSDIAGGLGHVLNPESVAALAMEIGVTRGAGLPLRLAGAGLANIIGTQIDLGLGRLMRAEQTTLGQGVGPGELAGEFGTGVLGQGVGEAISVPFRRMALAEDAYGGLSEINKQARKYGIKTPLLPAEATEMGRTKSIRAANLGPGRRLYEDRLSSVLDAVRTQLREEDVQDMTPAQLRQFVADEGNRIRAAASSRLQPGNGPLADAQSFLTASRDLENVLDTQEIQALNPVRDAFLNNNLAVDVGSHRADLLGLARKLTLGVNPETGESQVLQLEGPRGELANILMPFISDQVRFPDLAPMTRDALGREFNPLDYVAQSYMRVKKLQGSGDRFFNDEVNKAMGIFEDMLTNPVRPPTPIEGIPGAKFLRSPMEVMTGEQPRVGGRFAAREVPPDFADASRNFLDTAQANTEMRDMLVTRAQLEEALSQGRLEEFGGNMINPANPSRLRQIDSIMRATGRKDQLRQITDGYKRTLLEQGPDAITKDLDTWSQWSPDTRKLLFSDAEVKSFYDVADELKRFASSDIAKTAESANTLTEDVNNRLTSDDSGALGRLIRESGGIDGDVAKFFRFNIAAKLIRESSEVGHTGQAIVNPGKLSGMVDQLLRGGNADLLYNKEQMDFLRALPGILDVMPKLSANDAGSSLLRQELAGKEQRIMNPMLAWMPTTWWGWLKAREEYITSAIWVMYAQYLYNHQIGSALRSIHLGPAARAASVGLAEGLRSADKAAYYLKARGYLKDAEDIIPTSITIQRNLGQQPAASPTQ